VVRRGRRCRFEEFRLVRAPWEEGFRYEKSFSGEDNAQLMRWCSLL
jgi:hypothetical protein